MHVSSTDERSTVSEKRRVALVIARSRRPRQTRLRCGPLAAYDETILLQESAGSSRRRNAREDLIDEAQRLIAAGAVDVIVVEALDQICRDMTRLLHLRTLAQKHGIAIRSLDDSGAAPLASSIE